MIVQELVATLGLEMDEASFARAASAVQSLEKNILAFGAAALGAAALGLAAFTKATANAADSAGKLAQKSGVDSQTLQEFAYAADLADVASEELAMGLKFLAKSGVKDVREGLLAISDQMAALPDDSAKVKLAVDRLGKSGASLVPMLSKGRGEIEALADEAKRLGLIFSKEDIDASEQFNDEINRLGKSFVGIRNTLARGVIPVLSKWVTSMKDGILALRDYEEATGNVTEGLRLFGIMAASVLTAIALKYSILGAAALASGLKATAAWIAAAAPILAMTAGVALLILLLEDLWNFFQGGDSLIGRFLEDLKARFNAPSTKELFLNAGASFGRWIAEGIGGAVSGAFNGIRSAALRALSTVGAGLSASASAMGGAFSGGAVSPSASVASSPSLVRTSVLSPQFKADITVNASPGMDTKEVAHEVAKANDVWWQTKMLDVAAGVE